MAELRLRHARDEDVFAFWRWRQAAPANAFGTPALPLTWEQHMAWFAEGLAQRRAWYVGELFEPATAMPFGLPIGEPNEKILGTVGAVRYDQAEEERAAWVSIVVAPERRGKGYGTAMLTEPLCGPLRCLARIHRENMASLRTFEKAGYTHLRDDHPWPYRIYERKWA